MESAFYMLDSLNTAFIGENFGDANEKAYMDIRTYGEASLTQVFPIWPPIHVSHFAPPFLSPHHTRYFCRFQCCAWVEDVFTHTANPCFLLHIYITPILPNCFSFTTGLRMSSRPRCFQPSTTTARRSVSRSSV